MKLDTQNAILIVLCLVLLLGVFTLSANAATISEDVDPLSVGLGIYPSRGSTSVSSTLSVMPQVVEYDGTQSLLADGTYVGSLNNNGYYAMVSDNPLPCFACGILGYTRIISLANFNGVIGLASANAGPSYFSAPAKRSDFGYDFWMWTFPSAETFGNYLPQYDSLSSAMDDIQRLTYSNVGFLEIEQVYSGQSQEGFTSGTPFAVNGSSTNYAFRSDSSDVYCFAFYSENRYVSCFVSHSSTSVIFGSIANTSGNNLPLSLTYQSSLYYNHGPYGNPVSTVPVYSSLNDGLSAFMNYTPEPEPVPASLEYSLPPGNIIYIPIASGQGTTSYTLTTTYYMAFGNNDTSRINQVVTVRSALPSSTNNVAPSSPLIPWTNNGNLNLLGMSSNKIYQSTIPSNLAGQYLVIVNPLTMPSQTGLIGGDTYTNGNINISVSAVGGTPYVYPMSERLILNYGDDIGSESTYGDDPYTYTVDPDTGEITWTDPEGGNSAPVSGGQNPMPTPNTIFDWLRNISQQFSDFLKGPVQAVQVVVSAIRDFMSSFTQLYSWLPSPVYSLITSALMIALTIGVIKIFV